MQNIVITGSTSGIGKELVKLFCENPDNKIFAGYRNESKVEILGSNVTNFFIDMTNKESIIKAAEFIKSKIDKVDILINVAGCVVAGPVELTNTDRLRYQFDVNTFSHIEFTQNLLDIIDDTKIINISSMASFGNFPFVSPYCASKRALDILFNALEIETHKKIKVVSIKPGVISTPLWQKSVDGNIEYLNQCQEYEKELNCVKQNALKNIDTGLSVEKTAKIIFKIANKKNPKSSYTIGKDAFMAKILSYLPQDFVNKLIKFGMKIKFSY